MSIGSDLGRSAPHEGRRGPQRRELASVCVSPCAVVEIWPAWGEGESQNAVCVCLFWTSMSYNQNQGGGNYRQGGGGFRSNDWQGGGGGGGGNSNGGGYGGNYNNGGNRKRGRGQRSSTTLSSRSTAQPSPQTTISKTATILVDGPTKEGTSRRREDGTAETTEGARTRTTTTSPSSRTFGDSAQQKCVLFLTTRSSELRPPSPDLQRLHRHPCPRLRHSTSIRHPQTRHSRSNPCRVCSILLCSRPSLTASPRQCHGTTSEDSSLRRTPRRPLKSRRRTTARKITSSRHFDSRIASSTGRRRRSRRRWQRGRTACYANGRR